MKTCGIKVDINVHLLTETNPIFTNFSKEKKNQMIKSQIVENICEQFDEKTYQLLLKTKINQL
jgi:hypothetical protein